MRSKSNWRDRLARVALAATAILASGVSPAVVQSAVAADVAVDVTSTSVAAYHGNNRDALGDNDGYGEALERLTAGLRWQQWSAGVRLDGALYAGEVSADSLALQRALLNRYRDTLYPSKVSLTWGDPTLELTAGDFYAQFGRGLVLSVRKVDEFAYDTTVRGAKVDWNWRRARDRVGATLLVGYTNPVRVDEISGRRLAAPASWLFPGMPTADAASTFGPATTPTFRPDGVVGARVEAGGDALMIGAYGSLLARGGLGQLVRDDDPAAVAFTDSGHPAREAKYIEMASLSVSAPRLGSDGFGAAYLEAAAQRLDHGQSLFGPSTTPAPVMGHAVVGSLSLDWGPWAALFEWRHTRRFSPLMANVDVGRANEFFGLQYSAVPTTEPVTTDTELNLFAMCTTGGRARVDRRWGTAVIAYAALGFYRTWSERFGECAAGRTPITDVDRNDVWDPFVGVIVTGGDGRSRANLWGGARFDQAAVSLDALQGDPTRVFYREYYARYDALRALDARWALQVQGTHRLRREPETDVGQWAEGENYLAVHWASRLIGAFGYEYTTRYQRHMNYFNGSLLVRLPRDWLPGDSSVRVFAGQQRGALRCINGVCKVFPDFTGARVELVLRF